VRQIDRSFKQRYLEHIQYVKYNTLQSVQALKTVQDIHEYGPLQDTVTLLQHGNKDRLLNTME